MNLSQLIKQVNRDIDDSYSNADITDWFNRCLDDLTEIAQKEEKKTADYNDTNNYQLPEDLYKIVRVFVDGKQYEYLPLSDTTSTGYKRWNDQLIIQNGPVDKGPELYYYRKLAHLVSPSDIPEIEEPFQDMLILYALGNIQWMEEDYEQRPDALGRYENRKQDYFMYIQTKDGNSYSIQYID